MNNRLKRYAIVTLLVEKLNQYGSWCGETHIQKAMYFLKELFPQIVDYSFMLYKYGPFSFELRDDIGIMVTEGILKIAPAYPYGPRIMPGEGSNRIKSLFPKTLNRWEKKIIFIAEKLKDKDVKKLEPLATALYIIRTMPKLSQYEKTEKLQELKPHVSFKEARLSIMEAQKIIEEAKNKYHEA